jgi:precorrin-3B synthase
MSSSRRGACPSLAAPMPTGDGLLARIGTGGATISLEAMAALCAAARQHGNGIIEITARGSIQVRGLRPESGDAFAEAIAAFEFFSSDGVPILADPLAGLEPGAAIDAGELAAALRRRLATAPFAARLGPKVSGVIDAGIALHLDAVAADVRLRAVGPGELHVALGGDAVTATPLGRLAEPHAAEAGVRLLELIAQRGPQARARELLRERETMPAFRAALVDLIRDASAPTPRPRSQPIGIHLLRGKRAALGIGLAFGHTDADALTALITAAGRAGAIGLRAAPERVLLVIGLAREAAASLAAHAESLGFITRRDDPRRHVVACAGAPICAAAEIPARALAPAISAAAAQLLDGSLTLHVSGCAKGCAHPTAAALTIVGSRNGAGVIANGTARDQPIAQLAAADTLPPSMARLAGEVARAKRPHECAAETLARIGASRIAAILGEA